MKCLRDVSRKIANPVFIFVLGYVCAAAVVLATPSEFNRDKEEFNRDKKEPQNVFDARIHAEDAVCEKKSGDLLIDELKRHPKLPKPFESWGVVKRPGVVMPVTTLYNAHTRETLPIFDAPKPKPELLKHFFRCRGFGETVDMAPALLDTILAAATHFDARRVTIISGYRSPKFNDALAKKGRRVAAESRHMKGEAVDFRLDSAEAKELGPWLRQNFDGGIGTYRYDNFVHIDVGPRRSWLGH